MAHFEIIGDEVELYFDRNPSNDVRTEMKTAIESIAIESIAIVCCSRGGATAFLCLSRQRRIWIPLREYFRKWA